MQNAVHEGQSQYLKGTELILRGAATRQDRHL
jgi:hypothetical protein